MTKQVEYQLNDKTIFVQVSTHSEFINCVVDTPSPFKQGKTFLSPEININNFEKIVIKCLISEDYHLTILQNNRVSGQSICHETVECFIKENWKSADLIQIENINCSHFEQQYKFLIMEK